VRLAGEVVVADDLAVCPSTPLCCSLHLGSPQRPPSLLLCHPPSFLFLDPPPFFPLSSLKDGYSLVSHPSLLVLPLAFTVP